MKKGLLVITIAAIAMMAQAADLQWTASQLRVYNPSAPLNDGGDWAQAGVDLYLFYNGVSGSTALTGLYYDDVNDQLGYDGGLISSGAAEGTIVASYTTDASDYAAGLFNEIALTGFGLTWLGDTSANWDDMNLREFSIIAIADADDDYASGAYYNIYNAAVVNFSDATGSSGTGVLDAGVFDVSGAGALNVVPEPATALLFGIGSFGAWLVRRRTKIA